MHEIIKIWGQNKMQYIKAYKCTSLNRGCQTSIDCILIKAIKNLFNADKDKEYFMSTFSNVALESSGN